MTEQQRIDALRTEAARLAGADARQVEVVRSPYRICPLGAHVDHQLGEVTGMALDHALLFAFVPQRDAQVRVVSHNYPGEVRFRVDAPPPSPRRDWGDYLRGAAWALLRRHGLRHGLIGVVQGHENVGGLSSSAAVGVAYLLALERANGLELSARENIELDRMIENDYIGLNNGLLDQSTILLSRAGRLLHLDCATGHAELHPCGAGAELHVVILHSGLARPLADTDYNRRVAECREAARLLLEAAGRPAAEGVRLRDVPPEVFEACQRQLPEPLRRRARHFFDEQRRVREGLRLWKAGDLRGFGRLMSESGQSSIENYECGNRYLRTACRVLRETPGVLGARFSGAGFRGCSIGLIAGSPPPEMGPDILARYLAVHPDMRGRAGVLFCRTADGARLLPADVASS